MLLIGDLGPEVVSLIFEFINDTSPRTTKAIACVNKSFNAITKNIAHRHKFVDVRGAIDEDFNRTMRSWIDDESVLANIRTLTVEGWLDVPSRTVEEDEIWAPLVALLTNIGKLRQLNWNIKHPLPINVLDALESYQRASTLRIFRFTRTSVDPQQPHPIELRLAKSLALTHIRTVCPVRTHGSAQVHREIAFRSIVGSAPNLEYAGWVQNTHRVVVTDVSLTDLERCKQLFYTHKTPNTSVKQLTLDGYEISKQTLDDWSLTVDLKSLQNVKFSQGVPTIDYFQYAASALPNLEHLSLNLRLVKYHNLDLGQSPITSAIRTYITTCSPLKTMSLWSWIDIVPLSDVLHRHGASLEALQLHEREEFDHPVRKVLSLEDIQSVRLKCPNLRHFTFDLHRSHAKLRWDKDTNTSYYEELAKFEHLDAVQIYFDVGVAYLRYSAHWGGAGGDQYSFSDNSEADDSDRETYNTVLPVVVPTVRFGTTGTSTGMATATRPGLPPTTPLFVRTPRLQRHVRPSRDSDFEPYLRRIWATIFGNKTGPRHLDVKVGEWESANEFHSGPIINLAWKSRRHFVVRPHERDDVSEAVVKVHRRRRSMR